MKVVPSILSEDFDDFVRRVRLAESFTDYVQMDAMDGSFVDTRSFLPELISTLITSLSFEVHLMVEDPVNVVRKIHNPGLRKIIFHFESGVEHRDLADEIKGRGLLPGLAVRPETTLDMIGAVVEHFDTLLFLTVHPGKYGGRFLPEMVPKVSDARAAFPRMTIGVDGGISTDNIGKFYDIGVDYVCVGSRIFTGGRPKDDYEGFMKRLYELQHSQ